MSALRKAFGRPLATALLLALAPPGPAEAQHPAPALPSGLSWTDLADLTLLSPVILRATIERTERLSRRLAPDVPEGSARVLVAARLVGVLKADGLVPGRAEWLWQGATGAAPVRGADVLVFASPSSGDARSEVGQYRLTTARAQVPWGDAVQTEVRAILAEARAPGGVPRFRAIKGGFHVPGAVQGESESQFFVDIGVPVTIVVLRRAGTAPEVKIATGDIIDESAAPVRPRTLLWRTLACDAPAALADDLGTDPALRADWAAAKESFGACGRTAGQLLERTTPTERASG